MLRLSRHQRCRSPVSWRSFGSVGVAAAASFVSFGDEGSIDGCDGRRSGPLCGPGVGGWPVGYARLGPWSVGMMVRPRGWPAMRSRSSRAAATAAMTRRAGCTASGSVAWAIWVAAMVTS